MGAMDQGVAAALEWQAVHAETNGAPMTGRVVRAMLALLDGPSRCGARMRDWPGKPVADAMPLRLAGGLHWLHLTGQEARLGPVYAGKVADQAAVDAIVRAVVAQHDDALLPWFDGPPQTNEAARTASVVAGLLWLAARGVGARFDLNELGASAGAGTMIERYGYDLGGVQVGPGGSPVLIRPAWRGAPPPAAALAITSIAGCDSAPIDLFDPAAALRLKSYVWPEVAERMARLDALIALAAQRAPQVVGADAAAWTEARLALPQAANTVRAFYHTIVWQYISDQGQARITAAMERAGATATAERPLAWLMLETNRATFQHELRVRFWAGGGLAGEGEWHLLARAQAHGAWVEWLA